MHLYLHFYSLSAAVNCLTALFLGLFIFISSWKTKVSRILAYFCFSVSFWSFFYFLWLISPQKDYADFFMRTCMIGVIFMPSLFMHFIFLFLNIKTRFKIITTNYFLSVIFMMTVYTPLYAKTGSSFFIIPYWLLPGPVFHFVLSHFGVTVSYSFYLLWRKMHISTGIFKNQIIYVFGGTIIGFLCGSTNYFGWYRIPILPFLNIFISVYVFMVSYAIIKYRLLDIKIALTRAGIFVALYALILGAPFWLGYELLGKGIWFSIILFGMVLASLGPFVYNYLRGKAENIILKEQLNYQKKIKDFALTLIFIKDLKELCQTVVFKIMDSVDLSFCAIYLENDDGFYLKNQKSNRPLELPFKIDSNSELITSFQGKTTPLIGEYPAQLKDINLGLAIPLFLKQKFFGFILLGQKEKGIFTDTDLDAFSILSSQISLSLSEIHYFKEYQKATKEKYELMIEKERLESAFQIAEAYRHEVGNAIQLISLNVDSFVCDKSYQPSKEELEKALLSIGKNAKRAQSILDVVSSYNKKARTEFKAVELGRIVREKIRKQGEIIADKKINLKADIKDSIEVFGNDNLSEAVGYLIEGAMGAIEYFLPKERLISINLTNSNNSALLEIADTANTVVSDAFYAGVGIERGKEGGIYYFIARKVIFDHKGTFKIVPFNNGQGTKFIIEIPLKKKEDG